MTHDLTRIALALGATAFAGSAAAFTLTAFAMVQGQPRMWWRASIVLALAILSAASAITLATL